MEFHSTKVSQLLHNRSCLSKFSQNECRGALSRDLSGKGGVSSGFCERGNLNAVCFPAGELFLFSSALLHVNIFLWSVVMFKAGRTAEIAARSMFSCKPLQSNFGLSVFCFNAPLESKMKKATLDKFKKWWWP